MDLGKLVANPAPFDQYFNEKDMLVYSDASNETKDLKSIRTINGDTDYLRKTRKFINVSGNEIGLGHKMSDFRHHSTVHRSADGKYIIKQYPNTEEAKKLYLREKALTEFFSNNGIPIAPILLSDDSSLTIVKPYLPGTIATDRPGNDNAYYFSEPFAKQMQTTSTHLRNKAFQLQHSKAYRDFLRQKEIPNEFPYNTSDVATSDNVRFVFHGNRFFAVIVDP